MKVLAQRNIWKEYNYDRLLHSMADHQAVIEEVHVIPFTEDLDAEVSVVPDLIFGSNRFVNLCRKRGYPTYPSFDPASSLEVFAQTEFINVKLRVFRGASWPSRNPCSSNR